VSPYPDLAGTAADLLVSYANSRNSSRPNALRSLKPMIGASREIISVLATWATSTTPIGHASTVRNVHSHLRAILPEQLDGGLLETTEKLPGLVKLDANAQYLSLTVYLISNNMFEAENFSKDGQIS
jgi:hypothetical protein